jgi:1,4-alpha-glucan branching enzyme
MRSGNLILVLHTHLPWVLHHGDWPHGVDWLTEAVAECYIPLLNIFNELNDEGTAPKITIGISPVLCEQLEHKDFPEIFEKYCLAKMEAAEKDKLKFQSKSGDLHQIYLCDYWKQWYADRLSEYKNKYAGSIVRAFKDLQDKGAIEIITCGATHGYLPLLPTDKSINLQIKTAKENYKKHFGRYPRGIWLPECAYRPAYEWKSLLPIEPYHHPKLRSGIEQILSYHGIEYFISDEKHIIESTSIGYFADAERTKFKSLIGEDKDNYFIEKTPLKVYNIASSDKIEYGTTSVFFREHSLAMQVWSGQIGYPGEPDYLDFHKKEYGSMLRYWRVTDSKADMMYKTLYHPDWTRDKIDLQSNHFVHHIENASNYFFNRTGKQATVCLPFDTELFGHWWFEGPEFVKAVLKGLSSSPYVKPATCSEQLYKIKPSEVVAIPEGSWGENNNHDVWSNPENKWTWEYIYNDENKLIDVLSKFDFDNIDPLCERILKQAYRELLLEQSSDWQFLIHTQSAKDYAEMRIAYHHADFNKLCDLAIKTKNENKINEEDMKYLSDTETRNSLFQEIQLSWRKDIEF